MRAVFVIAMLGLVAAAEPAQAYCFSAGKAYVCVDERGNVTTWVQSPGGSVFIDTPADRSDSFPNAKAMKPAPKPSGSDTGGSGTAGSGTGSPAGSAVLQPSGSGAATVATPSAGGGATVLQGTGGGGGAVSTCASTGTCQQ